MKIYRCAQNYDDMLTLAESGDRDNVDLFVRDAAGGAYGGTPADHMVSSFGKVAKSKAKNEGAYAHNTDIALF